MIRIDHLGKHFDDRWVFRDLNLRVADGEFVVIVGPSGGGKSVLLKIACGLLTCDEGSVSIGSEDVGMLFQRNALFDSFTVEENLLFPLKERKGISGVEAKTRAQRMLKAVGLEGNEELYPDEISGGMQKRLGIARALIVEPKVILYDEPTAGLDPITSRTIADLILRLRKESRATVLAVTNDMQRAYQLGDRICLLANGTLRIGGKPDEVRATEDPGLRQFIYGLRDGPLTSKVGAE
jgi:phospholipid/cholesterol/gamma-HCH transport system ATP-binding protein